MLGFFIRVSTKFLSIYNTDRILVLIAAFLKF